MKHTATAIASLFLFLGSSFAQTAPGYVTKVEEFSGKQYLIACVDPQGFRCQVVRVCPRTDWKPFRWYIFESKKFVIGEKNSPHKLEVDTNTLATSSLLDESCQIKHGTILSPLSIEPYLDNLFVNGWESFEKAYSKLPTPSPPPKTTPERKSSRKNPGKTLK